MPEPAREEDPYPSAQRAQEAFYEAFEAADLEAMMGVWSQREDIVCIHPVAEPEIGRTAVARSWLGIFRGGPGLSFEVVILSAVEGKDTSVYVVEENIRYGEGLRERGRVVATNIFIREGEGWRLHTHHASPGSPLPGEMDEDDEDEEGEGEEPAPESRTVH